MNHVTQQNPKPHPSDQRFVVVFALGGALLCLLSTVLALLIDALLAGGGL